MSVETQPTNQVLELYNPTYITEFGLKEIEVNQKPAVVHDTNNLPHLFDAYFHKAAGIELHHLPADMALATLNKPGVEPVIGSFLRKNPELAEILEATTRRRDYEYEQRAEMRRRVASQTLLGSRFADALATKAEQDRRDFIYSVALDHIGDMTYRLGFDLNQLCR